MSVETEAAEAVAGVQDFSGAAKRWRENSKIAELEAAVAVVVVVVVVGEQLQTVSFVSPAGHLENGQTGSCSGVEGAFPIGVVGSGYPVGVSRIEVVVVVGQQETAGISAGSEFVADQKD